MSLRVALLSYTFVVCSATTLYNPSNAGNVLDSIETALSQIVNNPHLPAAQLKDAKAVATSVEATVAELESPKGKLLGKDARAAKVMSAIKLLQTLQDKWQKVTAESVSEHRAALMKQLKDKQAELAKEEKMLKVINLEKKLAEKKLALENLIEAKNAQAQQQAAAKDIAARQDMVASVLSLAKSLQAAQGKNTSMAHAAAKVVDGKAAMLKTVLTHLEGRMQNLTAAIAKIDAAEKRGEAKVKDMLKAPVTGKDDAIGKGQAMLKMLLKKEHRQFEKARAPLKSEFKELSEAVASIKKGDTQGLTKVMTHMQSEMKKVQARGGKFLY
jgi:hypothetical protein